SSHHWHDHNDFRAMEAAARRAAKPQYEQAESARYSLGIGLLGQERIDEAIAEFQRSRQAGFNGSGEYFARAYDARGQHAESDKSLAASTGGRDGWKGEGGVVTWIDRGQWADAMKAAQA